MSNHICAEINSRDEYSEGNGKTQRVHGDMRISVENGLFGKPSHLVITAFEQDGVTHASDTGRAKNVQRDLRLTLPVSALAEIVNAAIENGMVKLSAVAVLDD